jgi:type I thyroxine 5'-deiodinase
VLFIPEKDGKEVLKKITQTDAVGHRVQNAEICLTALKLSVPTVIDREDNAVNVAYSGWPDRMYVVGVDGRIAYRGGPGPKGFKPEEVDNWLKRNLPD